MNAAKSSDNDDVLEPLLQQEHLEDDCNNIVTVPQDDWMSSCKSGKSISSKTHNYDFNRSCSKKTVTINSFKSVFNARKRILVLAVILVLMCLFYSLICQDSSQRIPVIHHSHVPGMKALKIFEAITTAKLPQSSTVAITTLKLDKTNSIDRRSTEGRQMNSLRSSTTSSLDARTITTTIEPRVVNPTTSSKKQTTTSSNLSTINSTNSTILPPPSGYLVWSDKCKIPNIDPYTPEMMKHFKREKYESCSTSKPLTRVVYNSTAKQYLLSINEDQIKHYGNSYQLDCCYQIVERKSDQEVSLGKCINFRKPTLLPNNADNIIVKCKNNNAQVYKNGHPMIPHRPEIQKRLDEWYKKKTNKPISVLLIGIDSISRVNLIRAMPKTAQYLYDNEWFEMSGYNKMDDNTFPNLMAILTGYNLTTANRKCNPRKVGSLDKCSMIWKHFRDLGYVTAYAEDESTINTFNYLKKGFEKPPVDYYLRPFILSAEHNLNTKTKSHLIFCLGYQHSADYIYDYAIELSTRYQDDPYFGLFWANTFSHNALSDCSSMDDKMVDYLKQFARLNILQKSIVIFFSDHGMRFGPTRKYAAGHLEERLPFMFIWIPPDIKNSYPEIVNALSVNKNRLTCPYDIHMTLKHILEMSGRTNNLPHALDCPKCQTLLKPVPQSRSCDDVSIEDHWCTCIPYINVNKNSQIVKKISNYTIQYINEFLTEYENGSFVEKCAPLQLKDIQGAYHAIKTVDSTSNVTIDSYRIVFVTHPNNGIFEATVRYEIETEAMKITGTISRLDMYSYDSRCVSDGAAKKYCSCLKNAHPHSDIIYITIHTVRPFILKEIQKLAKVKY